LSKDLEIVRNMCRDGATYVGLEVFSSSVDIIVTAIQLSNGSLSIIQAV
jgi:hypothetical protein